MEPDLDLLRRNRVLALLGDGTLAAFAADLQWAPMKLRDPVMRAGQPIRHAWFPVDGVVSMLGASPDGKVAVEVGTIGNEGVTGLPLFLGRDRAPGHAFVQIAGHGWRMPAAAFKDAARAHRELADALHRFTLALLVQTSQGTACNRAHTPLQRCARWLLMTADRVQGEAFHLTQEFLGHMLGERRPTVSRAASVLRDRRLIAYRRGQIAVLDRDGLEDAACPCYRVIRDEYEALLAPPRMR